MYSFLLALIYLAFISLGLPDSLLGSGWPVMHADMGVATSYMGIVTMIISGGTIVSSLFSDKLTKKLSTKVVTIISVFLTVVALFGFSFSTKFWMLLVFAVPYGLGAGAIDAALNNYVAVHYKAKHMSWLHCFWGVGTIISPFIMGYALKNLTWNSGYRIVGTIQLAICIILLVTLPVWKVNKTKDVQQQKEVGLISALKIKGVPFLLIGFFAYCSAEATAMQWASTYFVEVKGISTELAANLAAFLYRNNTGQIYKRLRHRKNRRQKNDYNRRVHCAFRHNRSYNPRKIVYRSNRGFRCHRFWLRAHISVHNSLDARQLRRGKFGSDYRNSNGKRIRRLNFYAAAFRTYEQFARL